MSLIICPNCKASVSSFATTCPHCKMSLPKNEASCREYGELSENEKQKYQSGFQKTHPKAAANIEAFKKAENRFQRIAPFVGISFLAFFAFFFFLFLGTDFLKSSESEPPMAIIIIFILLAGAAFLSAVLLVLLDVKKHQLRYQDLISEKYLQSWLQQQGIEYEPILTTHKEKELFISIDLKNVHL